MEKLIYEHLYMNLKRFATGIKKTHLFYLVFVLFSGVIIFESFSPPEKDSQQGEYITMRIYENITVTSSRIIIVYADDKSEIIELAPFKYNDNILVKNNQVITRTLNKLRKEGFRIVICSASGKVSSSRDMMITTYLFER